MFSSVSSANTGSLPRSSHGLPVHCTLYYKGRGGKIFQKSRSHLEMLRLRRVTCSKVHTEDPQILGATVHNVVATANWRPAFAHSWPYILIPAWNKKLSRHGDLVTGAHSWPCILISSWNKKNGLHGHLATGICALLALYIDTTVK